MSGRVAPLGAALIEALDDGALAELADRLAPLLEARLGRRQNEWMNTREAAAYLRMGISSLHRLAKASTVPAHQDVPGGKYAFRRSELDRWRRAE